jgi:hypothetical protein
MSNTTVHDAVVQRIADEYRGKGYRVTLEPPSEELPAGIGNYRPDLVAVSSGESVVVEVQVKGDRSPSERFGDLARLIGSQPGWRFSFVIADPRDEGELPINAPPLTLDDVRRHVEESERVSAHSSTATFLLLWTSAEALLRMLAAGAKLPLDRVPPSILIRDLYSTGELSLRDSDEALDLLETRNALVHGFVSPHVDTATGRLRQLVMNLERELANQEHEE